MTTTPRPGSGAARGTPVVPPEAALDGGVAPAPSFDDAVTGLAVVDADGVVVDVNPSLVAMLGRGRRDLVGVPFGRLVEPDDRPVIERRSWGRCDAGDQLRSHPVRMRCANDGAAPVSHVRLTTSTVPDEGDGPAGELVQVVDDTDAVTGREALVDSEERFRALLDLAQDGIIVLDRDLRVTFVNRRLLDIVARDVHEVLGHRATELLHLVDQSMLPVDVGDRSTWSDQPVTRFEVEVRAADGLTKWVLIAANVGSGDDPVDGSIVATVSDVTDLKSTEAELRHRSTHDHLTGLANRALVEERWDELRDDGDDLAGRAVVYLDLDGFKEINDTYGHELGDRALAAVSRRLQAAVRGDDLLVRLGGDEFLVWVETDDERAVVRLADRLLFNLVDPFVVDGHTLSIGASAGIAVGRPADDLDELVRRADRALYEAKRSGRRRFVVHGEAGDTVSGPLAG